MQLIATFWDSIIRSILIDIFIIKYQAVEQTVTVNWKNWPGRIKKIKMIDLFFLERISIIARGVTTKKFR